jgi:uncharacterized protein
MAKLSEEMKQLVGRQRLGFVATVCPDGTPNLSPKGTVSVLDDEHLIFADIRSPATVSNLRTNPNVEVNVVDHFVRKGYRFKGTAQVLDSGPDFDRHVEFFSKRGLFDAWPDSSDRDCSSRPSATADLAGLRSRPRRGHGASTLAQVLRG